MASGSPEEPRRLCISAFKSLLPRRESEINLIRCNETLTLADFTRRRCTKKLRSSLLVRRDARRFQESNYVVDILSPYHNLISFCGGVGKRKLIAFLCAVRPFATSFQISARLITERHQDVLRYRKAGTILLSAILK